MLIISFIKKNITFDMPINKIFAEKFEMSIISWKKRFKLILEQFNETMQKLISRCPPIFIKNKIVSIDEAIKSGNTENANKTIDFISNYDKYLSVAVENFHLYLETGNKECISKILEIIQKVKIKSMGQSFVEKFILKNKYEINENNAQRYTDILSSHYYFNKKYYGVLLLLKFQYNISVTAADIFSGIIDMIFSLVNDIKAMVTNKAQYSPFEFQEIIENRDWVLKNLNDWIEAEGKEKINKVIKIWNTYRAKIITSYFDKSNKYYPNSPRDMIEWKQLVKSAHKMLYLKWCYKNK